MPDRNEHQQNIRSFLDRHFLGQEWVFSLPHGTGMETYIVQGREQRYFVKVGAPIERYLVMAEIGLTPQVLSWGQLEDGASVLVQPFIPGRNPSRTDFREQLESIAGVIHTMHHDPCLRQILEPVSSDHHKDAGLRALNHVRQKWDRYRAQVPDVTGFVDSSLDELTRKIGQFTSRGLVASHNDICNANWLVTSEGKIFIVDLESMSMDDPAFDMGALLWWYYAPELRERFLDIAGYEYDDEFKHRMQIRMALHCLNITLPRAQSFDRFTPSHYSEALVDFRAVLEGRENPQGYMT